MKLFNKVNSASQSLFAAAARLFGPSEDRYPETGVQPYTGDPNKAKNSMD